MLQYKIYVKIGFVYMNENCCEEKRIVYNINFILILKNWNGEMQSLKLKEFCEGSFQIVNRFISFNQKFLEVCEIFHLGVFKKAFSFSFKHKIFEFQ